MTEKIQTFVLENVTCTSFSPGLTEVEKRRFFEKDEEMTFFRVTR